MVSRLNSFTVKAISVVEMAAAAGGLKRRPGYHLTTSPRYVLISLSLTTRR